MVSITSPGDGAALSRRPSLVMLLLLGALSVGCKKLRSLLHRGDASSTGASQPLVVLDALSAGPHHTCAIKPTGEVFCWGRNLDSELGDGTAQNRLVPKPVQGLTGVTQVACGHFHSCAVQSTGEVLCWGRNQDGQLGDGSTQSHTTPVRVPGLADATQVTAGLDFTCALRRGGHVVCWGKAESGRLGNGSGQNSLTPVEVLGLTDATQIDAGRTHTCARKSSGEVVCWGGNGYGQSAQPASLGAVATPTQVLGLSGIAAVAAGENTTCAVGSAGTMFCWGYNYRGQVGNGQNGRTAQNVLVPFALPLSEVAEADVGDYHTCARQRSGAVQCWGDDGYGNLGGEQRGNHFAPAPVARLADATAIALGGYHVCALRRSGAIACWGSSDSGQLGAGPSPVDPYHANDRVPSLAAIVSQPSVIPSFAPVPGAAAQTRAMLSVGEGFACALRTDGHVVCWGYNNSGELGNGTTVSSADRAVEVPGITDAVELRAASNSACARRANGTLACWGYLGRVDSTTEWLRSSRPVPIEGVTGATGIARRGEFCVLNTDDTVNCLSNGVFTPMVGLTSVAQIVAGFSTTCARRIDGSVFCWGSGHHGMLGNGSDESSRTPVAVTGLHDATELAGFNFNVCALRRNGRVVCWGDNEHGTLGDGASGSGVHSNVPVEVAGLDNVAQITVGLATVCALKRTGEALCWGKNNSGQTGIARGPAGAFIDPVVHPSPVVPGTHPALGPMGRPLRLECGSNVCCALHENNGVSCWGSSGVLGSGSFGGLFSGRSPVPLPLTHVALGSGAALEAPPTLPAPPAEVDAAAPTVAPQSPPPTPEPTPEPTPTPEPAPAPAPAGGNALGVPSAAPVTAEWTPAGFLDTDVIAVNMVARARRYALGYVPVTELRRAAMRESRAGVVVPGTVVAGYCYRIIAVSEASIRDLDMVLYDPSGHTVDSDRAPDNNPVIGLNHPLCIPVGRPPLAAQLRVRAYSGAGNIGVQIFAVPIPSH